MKLIEATSLRCTGESRCRSSQDLRLELNNMQITPSMAKAFADAIYPGHLFRFTFSSRRTKNRWGTAWLSEGRLTLYRHSVHVFLHELAHLSTREAHTARFARELDKLVAAWRPFEVKYERAYAKGKR